MKESELSKYKLYYEDTEKYVKIKLVLAAIKGWKTRRKNARKNRQSR